MTDLSAVLILVALCAVLVLQLVLLLRRSGADPAAGQAMAGLLATLERQSTQINALQTDMKVDLVRYSGDAARDLATHSLKQTELLKDSFIELQKALYEGAEHADTRHQAQLATLTSHATALRETLADNQAKILQGIAGDASLARERHHALTEGLTLQGTTLRQDLSDRLAKAAADTTTLHEAQRTAMAEAQTKVLLTLAQEATQSRDLLDVKLKEMREANEQKLAEIQKSVNEQLASAVEKQMNESFNRVIDKFDAVQKAMVDVQAVTGQIGDIKRIFSNVKTRGGWGETQVKAVLDDIMLHGYETNKRLREDSLDAVEFAVIMPHQGPEKTYLAVDAKFPLEDYERLLSAYDAGDAEAEAAARRALQTRIRLEAAKIAEKYICPPHTVDFAVMYLPTEGLYAEVARVDGLIESIGREQRVLILGPSLLPALVRTIQLGHLTLRLNQNAEAVRELLGAAKAEMAKMDQVLTRLDKQASTFGRTISEARRRTTAVSRKLRTVDAVSFERATELLELSEPEPDAEEAGDAT